MLIEVCMEVTGCGDGCVAVGLGVGGWMCEFWTSGIVYVLILTKSMSLTQFGQKVGADK